MLSTFSNSTCSANTAFTTLITRSSDDFPTLPFLPPTTSTSLLPTKLSTCFNLSSVSKFSTSTLWNTTFLNHETTVENNSPYKLSLDYLQYLLHLQHDFISPYALFPAHLPPCFPPMVSNISPYPLSNIIQHLSLSNNKCHQSKHVNE